MAKRTVAIVGATGTLGKHLTNGFLSNGSWQVTCVARQGSSKPERLEEFQAKGAAVKTADYGSVESLTEALRGQEVVVSALGGGALSVQPALIAAAKAAGVKRFVPSEFGTDIGGPGMREAVGSVLGAKYEARELVEASGMEWTYVCNGFFMETFFTPVFHIDVPHGKAVIKGRTDVPFTLTSLVDIGRWTAQALQDPASRNTTVLLKGEDVTMNQAIATVEEVTGRKLDVTRVSEQELEAQIAAAPNKMAVFGDILLKATSEGRNLIPDDKVFIKPDQDTLTVRKYAALPVGDAKWQWGGL